MRAFGPSVGQAIQSAFVQALLAACLIGLVPAATADNFVTLALPQNVTVRLPKHWIVLTNNQRMTLETAIQARMETIGRSQEGSASIGFAANHYDDLSRTTAIFNVRYIPEMDVTQAELRSFTKAEMLELDAMLMRDMKTGVESIGSNRLLSWKQIRLVKINGTSALLADLRRSSPQGPTASFRVRTLRFLRGPRTVEVTMSYREDAKLEEAIADRVLQTLAIGP